MRPLVEPVSDAREIGIGRRSHGRLRVSLPARLVSIHSEQRIEVQNVSQDGMKLRWGETVEIGSEVFVSIAGVELFGRVVWASDSDGGILLDQSLPETVILAMREQVPVPAQDQSKNEDTLWALRNWRRTGGQYWWK